MESIHHVVFDAMVRQNVFLAFAGQVILIAVVWAATGKFHPQRQPDTGSYERYPWQDLRAALQYERTGGFPLLLRVLQLIGPGHRGVPILAFVVQVLAVVILWRAIAPLSSSPWLSMWVASSPLYSHFFYRYGNHVTPDHLAAAVSLMAVGFLLHWVRRPCRRYWWALLGSVFLAYQLRPIYLFLLVFAPVSGVVMGGHVHGGCSSRPWPMRVWPLVSATWLPFLMFCTFRWGMTGHFGVVAFGGANFAGVVTAFLEADEVGKMPPSVQPLARAILKRRQFIQQQEGHTLFDPTTRYTQIESGFDQRTWQVCVAAAQEIWGEEWVRVDENLWRLAWSIVWRKPDDYVLWYVKAFLWACKTAVDQYVLHPVYGPMIVVLALFPLVRGAFGRRRQPPTPGMSDQVKAEWEALWELAVLYFVCKTAAVIVTTPPVARFVDAASLLASLPLTYAFFRVWIRYP